MRQYDVYPLKNGSGYFVDIQSHLLEGISTRIVVPLIQKISAPLLLISDINPTFILFDEMYVFMPQLLASISVTEMRKSVTNLSEFQDQIKRSLDKLLSGL